MAQNRQKQVDTIGSVEIIDLPKLNIYGIPAKIDTGAESSAIWASAIKLKKGTLEFKLFAPGSAFYSGKLVRTKDFNTAVVRNSFGTKEYRYKVGFLTSLGQRKIKASFTLADRSGMSYPVLLGRNTLRNKYVVDVSKLKLHDSQNSKRRVLILTAEPKANAKFFKLVGSDTKNKTEFTISSYKDLAFFIKTGHMKVIDTKTNRDLGSFDVAYLKTHRDNTAFAVAAANYLQFKGAKFFDKELLANIAYDKLTSYTKLALHNMPIPNTICAANDYLLKNIDELATQIGWPMICKEINSDRGRNNFLVSNKSQLRKVLRSAKSGENYMIQSFVPNNGWLRILVLGRSVELFIARDAIGHDDPLKQHLNKPGGSVNARLLSAEDIDPTIRDMAIRAADITNRQIAGVDVIQNSKNKRWMILEVNNSPQLSTGAFVSEKAKTFAKFIDFELNR